jgi:hypothetical protein
MVNMVSIAKFILTPIATCFLSKLFLGYCVGSNGKLGINHSPRRSPRSNSGAPKRRAAVTQLNCLLSLFIARTPFATICRSLLAQYFYRGRIAVRGLLVSGFSFRVLRCSVMAFLAPRRQAVASFFVLGEASGVCGFGFAALSAAFLWYSAHVGTPIQYRPCLRLCNQRGGFAMPNYSIAMR